MLSVLIPIYNFDVKRLVTTLDQQLTQAGIPYEIIMADDCSEEVFRQKNAELAHGANIQYIQNETNMGRAKIRNHLADIAQHPYLLFIDCDAAIQHQHYIKKYIDAIETMRQQPLFVINGGVAYQDEKPDNQYILRWTFGKKREEESAAKRALNPYHHFTPFNVVITKSLFQQIKFDETLTTYGHEDTLFGCQLKAHHIPYLHINNTLIHKGLDTNTEFLHKIRTSIDNLILLSENQKDNKLLFEDNRLLKTYQRSYKLGMLPLLRRIWQNKQAKMEKKLSLKPSIYLLDLYKLSYMAYKKA